MDQIPGEEGEPSAPGSPGGETVSRSIAPSLCSWGARCFSFKHARGIQIRYVGFPCNLCQIWSKVGRHFFESSVFSFVSRVGECFCQGRIFIFSLFLFIRKNFRKSHPLCCGSYGPAPTISELFLCYAINGHSCNVVCVRTLFRWLSPSPPSTRRPVTAPFPETSKTQQRTPWW